MVDSIVAHCSALTLRDMGAQFAVLRAALTRLGGCALPGPARLALAEAEQALNLLQTLQPGAVEDGVFATLLALAGPERAAELTQQMAVDLRQVQTSLAQGLAQSDARMVDAHSHVLVMLAGTAGARGLQHGAQALNRAAMAGDMALMHDIGPSVLAGVAALIGFVETADKGPPK
ncbi:hypothetical protein [Pseudotabrizicola formosa]|uniref:hypothetical protein n=1 Tax=Pseudotabrizicola formosa TaxID=2030009 RepID=UPI000CD0830F|nr:hypothetical protein [Pseudotabrizicola formosa]